jgi:hypothetical protein
MPAGALRDRGSESSSTSPICKATREFHWETLNIAVVVLMPARGQVKTVVDMGAEK